MHLDPDEIEGVVWHRGSAAAIPLPDTSVPCIVTSPPYNCGIDYPTGCNDSLPWKAYWARVDRWAAEMSRVLMPGGRCWVVLAPTVPKTPGEPGGDRVALAFGWTHRLGAHLDYRDQIIWRQAPDGACAWGSWRSPSAPNVRGRHEVVLCFYKPPYARPAPYGVFKATPHRKGYADPNFWRADGTAVEKKESYDPEVHVAELGGPWTDLVSNVWDLRQVSGPDRYPASFPVELAARCIRLSTWPGEIVCDPFAGGGTTGAACEGLKEQRRALLVDLPAG